jgi:Amt family ammonium transporter
MDWEGIGRVAANTTIAACAGGMVAVLFVYPRTKKWDLGISVNGFLGGLVAITCPCYWVSPWGAVVIGAVAGVVVPLGINLLEHLRIDDPIGAVPVHAFAGIWGTLSLGLLATGQYGIPTPDGADTSTTVKGLFYGGGLHQLEAQFVGSLACVILVTGVALIIMYGIKQIPGSWNLRLAKDLELEGLDITEHGTPAYHVEFGYGMSYTTPTGSTVIGGGMAAPIDLGDDKTEHQKV